MIYLDIGQPSHLGGPNPKDAGWLYISYDCRDLRLSKIGMTRRPIFDRIFQSTTNPFYMLFVAFRATGALLAELPAIEEYFTRKFGLHPLTHPSGRNSEWWPISPPDALIKMIAKLANVGFDTGGGSSEGWDFTQTVYFPKINPYSFSLALRIRDDLVWMAAPEVFLQEVASGGRLGFSFTELDRRIRSGGAYDDYFLRRPSILIERINYYRAFDL